MQHGSSPPPPEGQSGSRARIASMDQFRGYTVLGMFVVNFLGFYAVVPAILKHHNTYCSFADTIMPQFFFAVGFSYRLVFLRRAAGMDRVSLYLRFVRRSFALILLGALLYGSGAALDAWQSPEPPGLRAFVLGALRRDLFQALVHIGVTALWIMPVIGAGPVARVAFGAGSAAIQVTLSHAFYYRWVMDTPGIDGGPVGFLTWSVPMLAGSLAHDMVTAFAHRQAVRRLAWWGAAVMILGYGLSCLSRVTPPNACQGDGLRAVLVEPPLVPPTRPVNLWTMNQRAGSISYMTFGAGLSLALYACFVWASDVHGLQVGVFRTLGTNALAGYVLHMVLDQIFKPWTRPDAAWPTVLAMLALFLTACYLGIRLLERHRIFLRL